uniref:Helicase ATP-binding domain-containing protein n=1 Tax=Panagrolaimus davidi TaxID=227884 RepID=A0A914QL41_9BILA
MKQFADLKTLLPILESSDLKLRQHQIDGIETVIKWINGGHGGIMADEMGLGKTCQAVITLALKAKVNPSAQFLIICPLSVIEHWENEIIRFGCGLLNLFVYKGYKEAREDLRSEFSSKTWNYFRMDEYYFDFPIEIVIIDEAHSVKSQTSQLHQMIRHQKANFHLLLTGTPIQNDILEFYSLLSLSDNKSFRESDSARDRFLRLPRKELEKKLKDATEKYVLRRLKSEVCKELPSSEEVILLHSLTNFQKQLYNAVLVSNHG